MRHSILELFTITLFLALLSFPALAEELPPGVPNPLNPDGTHGDGIMFTTKPYRQEALKLLLKEANRAAQELSLPENLPITESNIVGTFVNPFGYAYVNKRLVPIFDIYWEISNKPKLFSDAVYVQIFTPTKTLLQLDVHEAKYILRPPMVVTNLAVLLSQTNTPRK